MVSLRDERSLAAQPHLRVARCALRCLSELCALRCARIL